LGGLLVDVLSLAVELQEFSAVRDWEQFHTPKNLVMALSVEAAELLELFQWLTPEQSAAVKGDPQLSARVGQELADVLAYLVRLADVLAIDLNAAVIQKLETNAQKYPVDRGSLIRRGLKVPHARHWERLTQIADVE
jgi:dCTP diphosphatase